MDSGLPSLHSLPRTQRRALTKLLTEAVAQSDAPGGVEDLRPLITPAPIEALPAAAALHRVSGIVARAIDGIELPDDVIDRLNAQRQHAALHHLILTAAMSEFAKRFDAAGLSWAVIKGPVLAAMLYGDAGDRSYADLDLLVDRGDYPAAMQILEELGYTHIIKNWALAEQMLAGQVELARLPVRIDLHWHLHYSRADRRSYRFQPSAMLARQRRVNLSGVAVPTLDPVDTLITLGFHAARSDGHRLVWMKDLERSLAVDRPDLDELRRRAATYRCAAQVGLMLDRARRLIGADVPLDLVHDMVPSSLRALDRVMCVLSEPIQLHDRSTAARRFTRSVRSSALASLTALPARTIRAVDRRVRPPKANETDDPAEKASYLASVVDASEP